MKRICRYTLFFAVAVLFSSESVRAVDPNPLQDAYWRFEEGTAGADVPTGANSVTDHSTYDNHMQTANANTAPTYTSSVPPTQLRSGLTNSVALDFTPNQDIYTLSGEEPPAGKYINNPIIENGFTLEAAFMPHVVGGPYQGIVGKDGKPSAGPEQTLALKVRGDTGELQIELFDNANTIHGVRSSAPLTANQWYYAAVVNDGTNLSLYLDRNDGAGYVLQGTDPNPLSGALASIDSSWTIGRGMHNNNPTDWFDGIIDEVRITNHVLSPSQFLFAPVPEPGSATLVLFALLGFSGCRRATRRR